MARARMLESSSPSLRTRVAKNFITNNSDTEIVAAIAERRSNI
jgi:hypothetical protein